MIDIALSIESLIPSAQYFGSTTANTKQCFDDLNWQDARPKPTWKQIQDAYAILPEEIKNPEAIRAAQRAALLNRIGLTADELKIILG